MSEVFSNKVEQIVLTHIQNEKFGVNDLASELGLSRSQVLRKVKATSGKSINQFIREIRLQKGAELLRDKDLTASEIAYQVGFSSPSYFNKCFLDYFGTTPGEYKKQPDLGNSLVVGREGRGKNRRQRKTALAGGLFVMIILATYFMGVNNNSSQSKYSGASIAVLPLLDLSENNDKEYLADGITEAITLELSQNESIRVISRGSAMKYKGETKLYSEVAKELGVTLLLEGSLLSSKDTLRVVVQLIEPFPEEKHIWANSYDQGAANILELVHNVSSEIAEEIFSVVKPDQKVRKKKVDAEAYDLYLRGRHLWNSQRTRYYSLQKALEYLDKSIEKDPGFAPAYVTLAETYLAINTLILDNEEKFRNRENARKAIQKAYALDQSLAEVYTTQANLAGKMDWDWELMKDLAAKALKLDPSNVGAHLTLSNYYVVKGAYKWAIDEAATAEALDPVNPAVGCVVAERYYIAGDFEKAIEKYNDVIELNPNYGFAYNGIGFVYFKAGFPDKAVEAWQKLQSILGNDELGKCYDDYAFQDCFKFYLSKAKQNEPRFCSNPVIISTVEMLIDDEKGALEYLDIAYRYKNEDLPVMLTYPDFYALHASSAFQEIAKGVGVLFPN
ncbi:helix-turn-helix domain-containing protein [Maribellus sp. CM-23]|uniref:helix-turn-helix domain-containing protein n=1 Tax=Maribellus sp. CM-23 TaxID=2781026 RepID=UPI001F3478FF|nr:helix-turn-helix domain-containing protein [Maribellus sp. CM-23]MCE4563068.1 helix-turn-helix domain-containing protein [Maribellus sp. CM-23]